ncbi:hypothetical protein FB45DRAFT_898627 [Roridomyces roridus]|uniref:F-box domain-containing protein n=1 Tax=Roridomyces roridus TaxID=1738132 RepID=A0AAD7CC53_9AGAR|nr:hypothetical protein FB45DRAFT_898627 [Roridomyces roridus]
MSPCERIPNELWLQIFQLLPRESIKQLFSSDRRFSAISRTLLFSHLVFHPYHIRHFWEPTIVTRPSPQYIQLALDRLNFWSSDEIAPLVRECTIMPLDLKWERSDSADPSSSHDLLTTFFDRIDRFGGLRMVRARYMCFSQATLATLCHLPCLDNVVMDNSGVADSEGHIESGLQLHASRFVYRDLWGGISGMKGLQLWIPLLNPDDLRELDISGGADMPAGPPFHNVHRLHAQLDCESASDIFAIWSRFPAVRVLAFKASKSAAQSLTEASAAEAAHVLPLLEEYNSYCQLLPLLPSRPTLTRLVVDSCAPGELVSGLRGMVNNNLHITSLDATLNATLRENSFIAICKSLPKLVGLHINILTTVKRWEYEQAGKVERATDFFSTLAETPTLPPTLERLAITWKFDEGLDPLCSPVERIPDFPRMRDSLVGKCPDLKTLWLDGDDFLFGWRRYSVRRVDREDEASARVSTRDRVKSLRAEFPEFWE